jgi:hypothetical protein
MPKRLGWFATLVVVALVSFALLGSSPHAQAAPLAPAPWSDSLAEVGMPAAPAQWQPGNFDVQIHTRDQNTGSGNDAHQADHGADCSAPPAQHAVSGWQSAVFACHAHVMTSIQSDGYGEVVVTPNQLADWSGGPVTIGFSVSTQRTTSRDWITVDVSPFAEQLALPFDFGDVDLAGMPRHYVELRSGLDDWNGKAQTNWHVVREAAGNDFGDDQGGEWPYFEDATGIPPSAVTRTPFELTISASGYSFRVGPSSPVAPGKVLLSGGWSKPLTFTQGVVQFAHHSYNPLKCDVVAVKCIADTWHWSDFSISRAVPYTLLRPLDHQVVNDPGGVVTFAQGAPAGSFLKFAAIGSVQVSYDGGATYTAAKAAPLDGYGSAVEHFNSYLSPVPAGATTARLKLAGGWYGPALARDFSLVSLSTSGAPAPTPTPAPPTPTATPSPTSTPSPSPTPAPININGAPCMVTLDGVMRSGACSGTFTPA